MLSSHYFYHQLTRKYVILFGNMFNTITVMRKNRDTGSEIERFKVPIVYAPKEKYFSRLRADPDLNRPIQVVLPRMSFELVGFQYDATRKQNSLIRNSNANTSTKLASQYMGVPYNLSFDLQIYARNVDDGTHIVEQILPYFAPGYTITANVIPEMDFLKDIPIVLNNVTNTIEHEGNFDAVRYVTWTLNFTMKAYYFGPVSTQGIIRKVFTNIYHDDNIEAGSIVRVNTSNGNNGTYKIDDTVYQGGNYQTATAFGRVFAWNANTGKLVITGAQGTFTTNSKIIAVSTNASYNLSSFEAGPLKLVEIKIEPNPVDAEPEDDYGYTTTITEWPNTV